MRFKLSADRFINEGTLEVLVDREGERRTIERDEGNWNGSAAVELDVPVGGGWSLRGGAGYGTSFGDDDADSGIFSAGVGVALRF